MSANTISIIYLLRKYIKFSTFRSQSAKISCPRIGIFGNPRKYHVREKFLSYSSFHTSTCGPGIIRLYRFITVSSVGQYYHSIKLYQNRVVKYILNSHNNGNRTHQFVSKENTSTSSALPERPTQPTPTFYINTPQSQTNVSKLPAITLPNIETAITNN